MPGPTTNADPSCSLPQAVPRILTIEMMAGLASSCVWALVGVATELAVGGVRLEKTCGKPRVLRKFCRSPKTDGTCGRTPSIEWRMSDRATALLSQVKRLLGDEITLATSHDESSTATTATSTPQTASTWPR